MTTNIGGGRTVRVCDLCGQVDDHPRHVVAGSVANAFPAPSEGIVARVVESAPKEQVARLLSDLYDSGSSERHMDCCREAGCPDGTCGAVTAGAESKTGAALLKHLTKGT